MPLLHAVVHHIDKKPDGSPAVLTARDSELAESDATSNLLMDLNEAYNAKQGKGWGLFHSASGAHPLCGWLKDYLDNKLGFVPFTKTAVEHLTRLMIWDLEKVKCLCYSIHT